LIYFCGHTINVDGDRPIPIFPYRSPEYALSAVSSAGSQEEKAVIIFEAWDFYVSQYSKLDLSEPADKLLAISAIADAIGMTLTVILSTPALYRAGLWLQQMPVNLLWACSFFDKNAQPRSKYRAPSWSWVSFDGSIKTLRHAEVAAYHPACYVADVLRCETQLASNTAPYGQVLSGELQISGLIKEIPRYYMKSASGLTKIRHICLEDEDYSILEDCTLDSGDIDWIDSDVSGANHIIAVLCIIRTPRDNEETDFARERRDSTLYQYTPMWGLVLRKRAEEKAYSRIAIFLADRYKYELEEDLLRWQDSFERKTITIV
jgi:hypothetical protein